MSQFIAPGRWKPVKRQLAKVSGFLIGAAMIIGGLSMGRGVVAAVRAAAQEGVAPEIGMWAVILTLVPIVLGMLAVFPNVLTPILYRLIDKFMKDTPEQEV